MDVLAEAKRLYDLGFAVHWIKPGSKAPVKPGWSGPRRDSWDVVSREYRTGYGLGVRMGESSKLVSGGYLANIDIDLKSGKEAHRAEVLRALDRHFPGLHARAPTVKTSYGERLFIRTAAPVASRKLAQSGEETVVFMPTAPINRRQLQAVGEGKLKRGQLDEGYRVRPAWELELMSVGKQVVLPPSLHPETKKPYLWIRPLSRGADMPLVSDDGGGGVEARGRGRPKGGTTVQGFRPVEVDLIGSGLSDKIVAMILDGAEVTDRSAACFSVCIAMLKAGFSETEILSVLTDRSTFLGETAYDHRQTEFRGAAAAWVRDYCLRKAVEEAGICRAFEEEVQVAPLLEDQGAVEAQLVELAGPVDWRNRIERGGQHGTGAPKSTLGNIKLIFENAVSPKLFKLDTFAGRESYGADAPWVDGRKGKAIDDNDAVNIKSWLGRNYRFEPQVSLIFEAIATLAAENQYHPIRRWLESLPEWDGVERLDGWLAENFEARGEKEYLAQVFRKWLVASVTRVYEPGRKFDWMPILQGAQGTGKSSFGALLFGQEYFADWLPNLADKDAALGLRGKLCVEFGELDSLRKNEVETVKGFITRQVDNVRPPYGRKSIEIHRQCVFFGTTNRDEYFRDETGNRRFCPVEVGRLNFKRLRAERDQLWAEALFLYQNELEEHLYLEGEAVMQVEVLREAKMVTSEANAMQEALADYMEKFEKIDGDGDEKITPIFNFSRFRLMALFDPGGPLEKWRMDGRTLQFAARAVKDNGGRSVKIKGKTIWKIEKPCNP